MIRHCVMFKWADGTTDDQKQAVRDGLDAMRAEIPEIQSYSFGDDAGLGGDGNHDFVVVGEFADEAAYRTYAEHPVHVALIKELIRPIVAARSVIQYEV